VSSEKPEVSIVVPVYNEEESIPELTDWIKRVFDENGIAGEILFIDDGSTDNTWSVISDFASRFPEVIGTKFRSNQGKSQALQTGFEQVKGDIVFTMDGDLQDSPDEIPAICKMIGEEGFDMISGWKKKRHDPLEKRLPSKFFNKVTSIVSGIKLHDFNCGLKAYKHDVVKSLHLYGEMHRYIPLLVKWNGFSKIGEKVVQHRARKYGHTKFGMKRYITGFLDLISVIFVTRFKKKPMHFFGLWGTISFVLGAGITLFVIGDKIYRLSNQLPVRDIVDQPLFFLALVALIVGVQLFLAGFLAELILRVDPSRNDVDISATTED